MYVQYILIVKSAYGLQQIIAVNKANNDYNFAEYLEKNQDGFLTVEERGTAEVSS